MQRSEESEKVLFCKGESFYTEVLLLIFKYFPLGLTEYDSLQLERYCIRTETISPKPSVVNKVLSRTFPKMASFVYERPPICSHSLSNMDKQLCCCYTVKSQLNWIALKEAPAKTTNCKKPELIIAGY